MASLTLLTLRSSSSSLRSVPLRSYSAANASLTSSSLRIFQHRRRGFALKSDQGTPKATETTSDEASSQPSSSSPSNDPSKGSDVPPPSAARMRQAFASLDFEPHEKPDGMSETPSLITDGSTSSTGDARRMRTGAKSAKNSMSSIERRKRRMAWVGTIGFAGFLVGSWLYNGWDEDPNVIHTPFLSSLAELCLFALGRVWNHGVDRSSQQEYAQDGGCACHILSTPCSYSLKSLAL